MKIECMKLNFLYRCDIIVFALKSSVILIFCINQNETKFIYFNAMTWSFGELSGTTLGAKQIYIIKNLHSTGLSCL